MTTTSDIFSGNIEKMTIENKNYRKVLFTSPSGKQQLVLMTLKPNEYIGMEKHDDADQFIRIEKGNGVAQFGKNINDILQVSLGNGSAVLIPANTWHNIINTSPNEDMKLYTLYSPPQHEDKLVQENKPAQDGGYTYRKKYLKYKGKYLSLKNK